MTREEDEGKNDREDSDEKYRTCGERDRNRADFCFYPEKEEDKKKLVELIKEKRLSIYFFIYFISEKDQGNRKRCLKQWK